MAFAADILMGNHDAHEKGQIIGAVLVLLGFVFVNLDGSGAKREGDEVVEAGEIEFENNGGFDSEHVHDVNIVL
jgi:hypothetical protein